MNDLGLQMTFQKLKTILQDDKAPKLGGNLDTNGFSITGVTLTLSEVTKAATGSLVISDVSLSFISNFGQAAAMTLTLPAAAAGYFFIMNVITTGNAIHLKAGPSDKIHLNQPFDSLDLDDGDKVSNDVPTAGDSIMGWTWKTGASSHDWQMDVKRGLWVDGGP